MLEREAAVGHKDPACFSCGMKGNPTPSGEILLAYTSHLAGAVAEGI